MLHTYEDMYILVEDIFRRMFSIEAVDENIDYFNGDVLTSLHALQFIATVEKEVDVQFLDHELGPELIPSLKQFALKILKAKEKNNCGTS